MVVFSQAHRRIVVLRFRVELRTCGLWLGKSGALAECLLWLG